MRSPNLSVSPALTTTTLGGWRTCAAWIPCLSICLCALLAPAIWNRFAIVFHDTGGYVQNVIRWEILPGRSFFYGLFLWITSLGWLNFWGVIIIQSLLVLWVIRLMLRCHGLADGPGSLLMHGIALSALSGISWYTSQLMPDILVSLTVLAFWLLAFRGQQLSRVERWGLMAVAMLGMLSHMSCLALAIGLLLVTGIDQMIVRWCGWPIEVRVRPLLLLVIITLFVMPVAHTLLLGKTGYTPGSPMFLFGRLVQDGLAKRWLAEHCPVDGIRLCSLQQRLPETADAFLWADNSPFRDIGSWEPQGEQEIRWLNRAIISTYPADFLINSFRFTGQQLVKVATGDGLNEHHPATRGVFTGLLTATAPEYTQARQQQGELSTSLFQTMNRMHIPLALATVTMLPLAGIYWLRRRRHDLGLLVMFLLSALAGNAFICGALSNPHDRYQSRLIWIALLAVNLLAAAWLQQARPKKKASPPR